MRCSTITQQLAKNLYLWPGRSLARKGLEAWLALNLELFLPKKRILEIYLNIVELDRPSDYVRERQVWILKHLQRLRREQWLLLIDA